MPKVVNCFTSCNYASINATYGYDFVQHTDILCASFKYNKYGKHNDDGVAPLVYAILSPASATGNTPEQVQESLLHGTQAIICSK
jgi:hypothetical protein